jgi:hypothetical protein
MGSPKAPGKKQRPRKAAGRSPLFKWIVAAGVVGLVAYGVSQMSNIAYGEAEIKVIDFSGLDAKQRRTALEAANAARCTCGCGMTLAQCVATDSTCPVREDNIAQIRRIVDQTSRSSR